MKNIDRREFLKRLGMGTAAISAAALAGCDSKQNTVTGNRTSTGEIPTDKMCGNPYPYLLRKQSHR